MSGNINAVRWKARIARTGFQRYESGLEYRDRSHVFDSASLATLDNLKVQVSHDPGAPAVGHVQPGSHGRASGADGNEYLTAVLVITDATTIEGIRAGTIDGISMGYSCDHVIDAEGRKNQINIRFEHLALLRRGIEQARCGPECRPESQQLDMTIRQTDAIELDGTAADAATPCACGGRTDAAALNIDALVEARHNLLMRAGKLLPGHYDTAGKSNAQIRSDAVAAKLGAAAIAGKSSEYIAARFDALTDGTEPAQYHNNGAARRADAQRNAVLHDDNAFRAMLARKSVSDAEDDDAPAPKNVPTVASLTAQSAAEADEAFRQMLARKLDAVRPAAEDE